MTSECWPWIAAYHYDPKFLDQEALGKLRFRSNLIRVYTVCHSVCIFWMHYSKVKPHCSNFRTINFFLESKLFLVYSTCTWGSSTPVSRDMPKPTKCLCAQRRLRSAWASAQSDQSLRCALNGYLMTQTFFMRTAKMLIRLGRRTLILLVLSCRSSPFKSIHNRTWT